MNLYLALLRVQTRLLRFVLVGVAIAIAVGFALPWILDAAKVIPSDAWNGPLSPAARFLRRGPVSGAVLLITSLVIGLAAAYPWAEEGSRNRGVYLMTLPLERWHLVLLEFAVAVTIVAAVTMLVLVAGIVTAAAAPIPEGLHAYPGALAARFFALSLLVLSMIFGPARSVTNDGNVDGTKALLVLGVVTAFVSVDILLGWGTVEKVVTYLFEPGGPLHILVGRWLLVDI